MILAIVTALIVDMYITTALCYNLRQHASSYRRSVEYLIWFLCSHFRLTMSLRTQSILSRLIAYFTARGAILWYVADALDTNSSFE